MKMVGAHKKNRIVAGIMAAMLLIPSLPAEAAGGRGGFGPGRWDEDAIFHGTADMEITEDMVNNQPPGDYVVDETVHKKAMEGAYNSYFPELSLQTVSIEISEDNLNYLLQNATEEPYVMADSVTIGDVTLGYPGLRTKGNYTLQHSFTDNPGSDRFSFTINFGKYINKADYGKKQNFYGVDKISFNNFFFDKSMMKEFFALKLMDEMGLPTPQYGLAKLYMNGQYYGVYAMVESLDEPILEQYLGVDDDELSSYLCKPTGTTFLYDELMDDDAPLWEHDMETYEDVQDMLPTVMEWVRRLNCLSEGVDFEGNAIDVNSPEYLELLEQVMDVDEVVRYFAAHSWLCQMDNMFTEKQNFGLYIDTNGKCLLLPWDYDLSFGCYFPSEAESTANYDIEVMFRGVAEGADKIYEDYPLFNVIYQNSTLMENFKGYMEDCSKIATLGGVVEHTGKVYEPGYFNSFIEAMEEEIYQAASEELAENVYYMNRTNQPEDVKNALPNLAKIIAMRSVGVWEQVHGTEAIVCGAGCDLSTLGNANRGRSSYMGLLSVVDAASGIFVTADYGEKKSDNLAEAPILKITAMDAGEEEYQQIASLLGAGEEDILTIYQMDTGVEPVSEYTLHIPLSPSNAEPEAVVQFYRYDVEKDELTELVMTSEDNLYSGTTASVDCIVLFQSLLFQSREQAGGNALSYIPWMILGVGCVIVVAFLGKKFYKNVKNTEK